MRARFIQLAITLGSLAALFLAASVLGAVSWWPDSSNIERCVMVIRSLVYSAALVVGLSTAFEKTPEIPWRKLGISAALHLLGASIIYGEALLA